MGSADGKPDLAQATIDALNAGGGADGAPNPHPDRNAKRTLVQTTRAYLCGCEENGGLLSAWKGAVFPSALPHIMQEPSSPANEPSSPVPPSGAQFRPPNSPDLDALDSNPHHHLNNKARMLDIELDGPSRRGRTSCRRHRCRRSRPSPPPPERFR